MKAEAEAEWQLRARRHQDWHGRHSVEEAEEARPSAGAGETSLMCSPELQLRQPQDTQIPNPNAPRSHHFFKKQQQKPVFKVVICLCRP